MFDFTTLTVREASLIEDLSGLSIDAVGADGAPKAKLLAAITMIVKRRQGEKKFTFNQALDMTITEMMEFLGFEEEEPSEDSEEGKDERSEESATE